jgi:hypothetical protein
LLQTGELLASTVLFYGFQTCFPERLRKDVFDTVDKVNFSSSMFTPLVKDKPPLRCIMIFIDPLNNEFNHILQLNIVYSLLLFLLIGDFIQLSLMLLKTFKLHFRLENSIIDSHDLSLDLILPLFDVPILDKILKSHLEHVKLAFLAMLHSLL